MEAMNAMKKAKKAAEAAEKKEEGADGAEGEEKKEGEAEKLAFQKYILCFRKKCHLVEKQNILAPELLSE